MHCLNCGADVRFWGKTCGWCDHDKSGDRAVTLVVWAVGWMVFCSHMLGGSIFLGVLHGMIPKLLLVFLVKCQLVRKEAKERAEEN